MNSQLFFNNSYCISTVPEDKSVITVSMKIYQVSMKMGRWDYRKTENEVLYEKIKMGRWEENKPGKENGKIGKQGKR